MSRRREALLLEVTAAVTVFVLGPRFRMPCARLGPQVEVPKKVSDGGGPAALGDRLAPFARVITVGSS